MKPKASRKKEIINTRAEINEVKSRKTEKVGETTGSSTRSIKLTNF